MAKERPGERITPLEMFRLLRNGPLSRLDILNKFNANRTRKMTRAVLSNMIRSGIAFTYLSESNSMVRLNPQKIGELERVFADSEESNSEADSQNIKKKAIGKKRKAEKKIKIPSVPKMEMAANKHPKNKSKAKMRVNAAKNLKLNEGPKLGKKCRIVAQPQDSDDTAEWIVPSLPMIKPQANRIKPKRANMPQKSRPKPAALPKFKRKGTNDGKKRNAYNLKSQSVEGQKMMLNEGPKLGKKCGILKTNWPRAPPEDPNDTDQWIVPRMPMIKHESRKIQPMRANMRQKPQRPQPKAAALPKLKRKDKKKVSKVPTMSYSTEAEDNESYDTSSSEM